MEPFAPAALFFRIALTAAALARPHGGGATGGLSALQCALAIVLTLAVWALLLVTKLVGGAGPPGIGVWKGSLSTPAHSFVSSCLRVFVSPCLRVMPTSCALRALRTWQVLGYLLRLIATTYVQHYDDKRAAAARTASRALEARRRTMGAAAMQAAVAAGEGKKEE